MFYGLSANDIYNVYDFITWEFQTLVLPGYLNLSTDSGSGYTVLKCDRLILNLNKNNSLNDFLPIIWNQKVV